MSPPPPASLAAAADHADLARGCPPVVTLEEEARLRRQAFVAVLFAALFIGFSPIFVRLADVGPAAIGFWRLFFSLGPSALWAFAEQKEARALARRRALSGLPAVPRRVSGLQLGLVALAGLSFGADLILFHAGLAITTTANGVLIGNSYVIFVFALGWMFLGERPTRGLVVAMGLALAGAALVISSNFAGHPATGSLMGDLLCLGGAFSYAVYMLFIRLLRRQRPGVASMGGGTTALLTSMAGMLCCLLWALAAGERIVPASLGGFLAVAGLGVVVHAGGQGLTTFALGRLPAGVISVVMLLQILVGVVLAAVLFGEIPAPLVLLGGAFLVGGVLAARPRARPRVR